MRTGIIFAAVAMVAAAALGDAPGSVTDKNGETLKGMVRWSARDKAYVIAASNSELQVKASDVQELNIDKPAGFDQAAEKVDGKKDAAAAIPVLEKIVKSYRRLQWDVTAGRYLAQAYLATGKPDAALKTCQDIIGTDSSAAYKGDLAPAYWSALLALGKTSQLETALERAFKTGDRYSSGAAFIVRGDMIMKDGNESRDAARKALTDGYLRVVLLYKDENIAAKLRPEALYKAARCFDKLQQAGRQQAMLDELKRNYPQSSWAAE
jgi:tetratricopeptide (TPR) repeat protein